MRDNFDRTFSIVKYVMIGAAVVVVLSIVLRASHACGNGKLYNITIPSMSNTMPYEYYATEYVESNGCITFKDEFGFEHKHCGPYTVSKW